MSQEVNPQARIPVQIPLPAWPRGAPPTALLPVPAAVHLRPTQEKSGPSQVSTRKVDAFAPDLPAPSAITPRESSPWSRPAQAHVHRVIFRRPIDYNLPAPQSPTVSSTVSHPRSVRVPARRDRSVGIPPSTSPTASLCDTPRFFKLGRAVAFPLPAIDPPIDLPLRLAGRTPTPQPGSIALR